MDNLFERYEITKFVIKKPRKDQEKLILRERLAEILGRTKKSIVFTTLIWTEDMIRDSIKACENYSDIKARNWHFNQYKESTKIK